MIRYQSRKFLLTLLIVLIATGLRVFSLIDGGMWVTVVSLALTVYVGGNVAQKATTQSSAQVGDANDVIGTVIGRGNGTAG